MKDDLRMAISEDDTKLYCMDVHTINEYIEKTYSDSEFRESSNRSKSLEASNDYFKVNYSLIRSD